MEDQTLQLFVQQLVNGIQLGSVYALIAIGYTMVYGVLKFINFAHGDVYMIGAYMGMFVVLGFHPANIDQDALVVVLAMVLMVGLIVSLRGNLRNPRAVGLRLAGFGLAFVLLKTLCSAFVLVGEKLFGGLTSVAQTSVLVGGAVSVMVSVGWCAALGVIIERTAYKPIRGTGRLTALITAIGVSLLLENGGQAVFGARTQAYSIASLPGGQELVGATLNLNVLGLAISVNRGQVIVLVSAIVLVTLLMYIVRRTRMGKAMRAVAYDREAAALMGINTNTVISFTFLIGSAMAGAGGFLNYGLTQFSFDTNTGIMFGLKAFVAAVLGGIGNLGGAVLGGVIMGVAETFIAGSPFSSFKDAIAFVILIAILLFRPAGLLGKYTVEKV